ncbi:hypothetical protein ABH963_003874 [Bacillus sp. RC55]
MMKDVNYLISKLVTDKELFTQFKKEPMEVMQILQIDVSKRKMLLNLDMNNVGVFAYGAFVKRFSKLRSYIPITLRALRILDIENAVFFEEVHKLRSKKAFQFPPLPGDLEACIEVMEENNYPPFAIDILQFESAIVLASVRKNITPCRKPEYNFDNSSLNKISISKNVSLINVRYDVYQLRNSILSNQISSLEQSESYYLVYKQNHRIKVKRIKLELANFILKKDKFDFTNVVEDLKELYSKGILSIN